MAATETKTVELDAGPISYRDSGSGDPILFVAGFLNDGTHWRKTVPLLEDEYRCIAPDWPLGSHRTAMRPDADLTPAGAWRASSPTSWTRSSSRT